MVGIAPVEIATESDRHVCVAGVVRCVHHEFAQGSEVALNAVEVAGRGRRRYQLNVVVFGPRANLRTARPSHKAELSSGRTSRPAHNQSPALLSIRTSGLDVGGST